MCPIKNGHIGYAFIGPVDFIGTGSGDRYSKTDMSLYNWTYGFYFIGYQTRDPVQLTILVADIVKPI
jgi:hypothetical protein